MQRVFSAALLAGVLILSRPSFQGREATQTHLGIDEVLRWFPEDTETLFVNQEPFQIAHTEGLSPSSIATVRSISLGPLPVLLEGEFERELEGQTVLLTVEASRHFRSPKGLGSMHYEGCHAIFFAPNFAQAKAALLDSMKSLAAKVQFVGAHRVMVFEEQWEGDLWKIYITALEGNVLLCATDENFIKQTLSRIDSGAERAALPESLTEWKHIDKRARIWAIRHYDKDSAAYDPSSPLSGHNAPYSVPDRQAIGVVVNFDAGRALSITVKYLSSNPDTLAIARTYWEAEGYAKPQIRPLGQGIVEISPAGNGAAPLILLVLGALGHGLYI